MNVVDLACTISEMDMLTERMKFEKKYRTNNISPTIEFINYDKLDVIGKGAFSTVILYRNKKTKECVIFKRLLKSNIIKKRQLKQILHEKRVLQAIDSPFIVKLLFSCKDNDAVYMVMPFLNGGDLLSLLRRHRNFTEPSARFFSAQLVLAIEYLHAVNVIHRDIKPENILIKENGYIVLADLGLSKIVNDRLWSFCGTPEYVAPEIIQSKGYDKAVDWWSLGVLIYEFCVGRTPFYKSQCNELTMYGNILNGDYSMPNTFSENLQDLVQNLIQTDLTKRLGGLKNGVNDIKYHKWYRDINWKALYHQELIAPIKPMVKNDGDTSNFMKYSDTPYLKSAVCKFELEFCDF